MQEKQPLKILIQTKKILVWLNVPVKKKKKIQQRKCCSLNLLMRKPFLQHFLKEATRRITLNYFSTIKEMETIEKRYL